MFEQIGLTTQSESNLRSCEMVVSRSLPSLTVVNYSLPYIRQTWKNYTSHFLAFSSPFETEDLNDKFHTAILYIIHDTFLQDFLVILKIQLQNYQKISKKCVLGTTCTVMSLAGSNFQSHSCVSAAAKGLTLSMTTNSRLVCDNRKS